MNGWKVCPWCPEDDNEWPEDCFTAAGTGFAEGSTPCNDCYTARYPRRRNVQCAGCGRVMETRGKGRPMCHPCRRGTKAATTCPVCGRDCKGVRVIQGKCTTCYHAEWRARHNVNGRQRVGAWTQDRAA